LCDYRDAFAGWNLVSSVGACIFAADVFVFVVGIAHAFIRRDRAAGDPWGEGATTLEWTLPSPFHQFSALAQIVTTTDWIIRP
jgi:cytochrome c oxidase subunit 1